MAFLKLAGTVTKRMGMKSACYMYPVVAREFTKTTRGHVELDSADCIYCGLCQRKCPTKAIEVNRQEKNWTIQPLRCIVCSGCVDVCPKKCLRMENTYSSSVTSKF
ncbi:MAG: 4Fe-4S dicluster domain-containing protein [Heliobacteriaceae bacterium]|nr:4Fe-4S dicluster domain-containing protein [Heliobacteriaceae bacterium]MDD4587036.1 4Fe-4S dicluster domain-containing protein [Heliobacteriaceae bacterium]